MSTTSTTSTTEKVDASDSVSTMADPMEHYPDYSNSYPTSTMSLREIKEINAIQKALDHAYLLELNEKLGYLPEWMWPQNMTVVPTESTTKMARKLMPAESSVLSAGDGTWGATIAELGTVGVNSTYNPPQAKGSQDGGISFDSLAFLGSFILGKFLFLINLLQEVL